VVFLQSVRARNARVRTTNRVAPGARYAPEDDSSSFFVGGVVMRELESGTNLEELLRRIGSGDREAAAEFVQRYAPVIRQRFRARLSPSLRRLMDSGDLVSTVGRRLDQLVATGGVNVENEHQLWALVNHLAKAAIADKARVLARLRRVESPDSDWARSFLGRASSPRDDGTDRFDETLDHAMDVLETDVDRRVLALWLGGWSHLQISAQLRITPNAARQHWHRVRSRLAEALSQHGEVP